MSNRICASLTMADIRIIQKCYLQTGSILNTFVHLIIIIEPPHMTLQPIYPILHCPLTLAKLWACPFCTILFPPLPLSVSCCFCVRCKILSARPSERGNMAISLQSAILFAIVRFGSSAIGAAVLCGDQPCLIQTRAGCR